MKFNDLLVGNFFTTYEQGKMLVGVKINAKNAINMATGEKIEMHFNRRVDAGKVTSLDLEKTTLARRQDEIILASPTENGRWLVHSFLITSTELCNVENLSFPVNTGESGNDDSEGYIIIQQLLKHLNLAVNWAESAKECLKVSITGPPNTSWPVRKQMQTVTTRAEFNTWLGYLRCEIVPPVVTLYANDEVIAGWVTEMYYGMILETVSPLLAFPPQLDIRVG